MLEVVLPFSGINTPAPADDGVVAGESVGELKKKEQEQGEHS